MVAADVTACKHNGRVQTRFLPEPWLPPNRPREGDLFEFRYR